MVRESGNTFPSALNKIYDKSFKILANDAPKRLFHFVNACFVFVVSPLWIAPGTG